MTITLRGILTFLAFLVIILFTGSLLAYPLYLAAGLLGQIEFSKAVTLSTQLCGLIFSFLYLALADSISLRTCGYARAGRRTSIYLLGGFAGGLLIVLLLMGSLMGLGIYDLHHGREISPGILLSLLLSATVTGFAVALFEETVFRGNLFAGLARQSGTSMALVTVSLVYAALHFIDYRDPVGQEQIGWLTAPAQFISAYSGLYSVQTLDALLALFILGLLLGLSRIHTGSLYQCIGIHAGLVAGIKIARFITSYQPGSHWDSLVSPYDHRLGYMAAACLAVAVWMYYRRYFRGQTVGML